MFTLATRMRRLPSSLLPSVLFAVCSWGCGPAPGEDRALTIQLVDTNGTPTVAQVPIAVHDEHGVLWQSTMTDAAGRAQVTVPERGMVSTFQIDRTYGYWDTVIDPPLGTPLHLPVYTAPLPSSPPTTVQVSITDIPADATTLRYMASCPRSAGQRPASESTLVLENCTQDLFDVIVIAEDDQARALGWGSLLASPVTSRSTDSKKLSLAHTDFAATKLQMTGIPIGAHAWFKLQPIGVLGLRALYLPLALTASEAVSTGLFRAQLSVPAPLLTEGVARQAGFSILQHEDAAYFYSGSAVREEQTRDLSTPMSFAANSRSVPSLHSPELSNPLRPRQTWDAIPFGEAMAAYLAYPSQSGLEVIWDVHAPAATVRALQLPTLPAEQSGFLPLPSGKLSAAGVEYLDDEAVSSYGEHLADRWRTRLRSRVRAGGFLDSKLP